MEPTTRPRDTQRAKVYRAEQTAFPEYHALGYRAGRPVARARPGVLRFGSTIECEVWVNRVLRNTKARDACRKVAATFALQSDVHEIADCWRWPSRVRVTHNQGCAGARAIGASEIRVSGYYRNALVLLHELAHLVAPPGEKHGPLFTAHFLALVRAMMGVQTHDRLRDAYKAHGVRFRPKRTVSPERRAVLVARLAALRAAKTAAKAPPADPPPDGLAALGARFLGGSYR